MPPFTRKISGLTSVKSLKLLRRLMFTRSKQRDVLEAAQDVFAVQLPAVTTFGTITPYDIGAAFESGITPDYVRLRFERERLS
ncbi:hypothetical protein CEK25_001371 [Fusarium fujikuroi]|nr:hypothetical protein CEK25_001371 [Fusarium fujikuroi]